MKISYNWLKSYLPVSLPASEVAVLLTGCGLEVEGMETYRTIKGGLAGLVIGEVKTCDRHPNADKLSLTTVDTGSGQPLQIVCGAPNVAAGQRVIVAPVGTTVHPLSGDPFEIKKSKIRGELSEGMICAEDEIGLGASHAGILVLPADAPIGMAAKDYFKVEDDIVFEIGLTPNRVDAASHIGVARDLAALLNLQAGSHTSNTIQWPSVEECNRAVTGTTIQVQVDDTAGCPRYSAICIDGVTVADSPEWLQHRLRAIGVGPVNNIVDITNFVLHECGQPLHAFDAAAIDGGRVIVRRASAGEKFVTLDQVTRELTSDDLMICNARQPMCIAGVFGGMHSGIASSTTSVFLESAYFDPSAVRKSSKYHGLKTDASFRFERGADPNIAGYALKRAALLITEIAGGKISSEIIDQYPHPVAPVVIDFSYDYLNRFAGHEIPEAELRTILLSLGMKIMRENESGCTLEVPTAKVDVTRPVDVVEEVLRIYGYDRIPLPSKLNVSLPAVSGFNAEVLQEKLSGFLVSNGFNELFTNSLTSIAYQDQAGNDPQTAVPVLNPLSQELGVLRQDLLHTGLEAIQYNRNRKQPDLRFFEFGKSYNRESGKYHESRHLALFLSGNRLEDSWSEEISPVDFYFMKGFVQRLLQLCGLDLKKLKMTASHHPAFSTALAVRSGEREFVVFGSLKRSLLRKFDIASETFYADVNWDALLKSARKAPVQVVEIPRFPQVRRDLSMVIGREVEFGTIEDLAYRTEKKLLTAVQLFDVYEGEKIEAGKKSYAIAFMLQDEQQTLTDQQIDKTMDRLMAAFEKEVGAVIRKA